MIWSVISAGCSSLAIINLIQCSCLSPSSSMTTKSPSSFKGCLVVSSTSCVLTTISLLIKLGIPTNASHRKSRNFNAFSFEAFSNTKVNVFLFSSLFISLDSHIQPARQRRYVFIYHVQRFVFQFSFYSSLFFFFRLLFIIEMITIII